MGRQSPVTHVPLTSADEKERWRKFHLCKRNMKWYAMAPYIFAAK